MRSAFDPFFPLVGEDVLGLVPSREGCASFCSGAETSLAYRKAASVAAAVSDLLSRLGPFAAGEASFAPMLVLAWRAWQAAAFFWLRQVFVLILEELSAAVGPRAMSPEHSGSVSAAVSFVAVSQENEPARGGLVVV